MSRQYIAIEPILHNGKLYAPKIEIELEEFDASQLLAIGHVIGKADEESVESEPAEIAPEPAEIAPEPVKVVPISKSKGKK